MVKMVLIGAGSHVFSRNLITDFLSYPEFQDSTLELVDIDQEALDMTKVFAKKLVRQHGLKTRINATTDRKLALNDANYVIVSIRVGGLEANIPDLAIPEKYGVKQGIGDTIGPGGVFYGLRHIPVLLDICHDVEDICPDSWLINYTNPMAMLCWAMNDYSRVKNIGLCHSVQGTAEELAHYINAPLDEVSYWVAGINHMAWFLQFNWSGKDAYPILREKFNDPEVYSKPNAHWAGADIVRAEIFKAFGYFNTESSQHMSEYVPYFRKRPDLFKKFKLRTATERKDITRQIRKKQNEEMKHIITSEKIIPLKRSYEYCVQILHSLETGTPLRINGNVENTNLIVNLPQGCCVEVPCLVDKNGINPCYVGHLPPQCAALNRTNINVQELGVLAAIEKSKDLAFQAILMDPLTSSILTIAETSQMVEEMFKAEARHLIGFKN